MTRKSRASASSIEGGVERGSDVSVASSAGRDAWDAASACAGALIWVEGAAFSIEPVRECWMSMRASDGVG